MAENKNKPMTFAERMAKAAEENKKLSESNYIPTIGNSQPVEQRSETPEERATYARLMGLNDYGASGMALELSKMDSAKEKMDKTAASVEKLQSEMEPQEHDPLKVDSGRIMQQNITQRATQKMVDEPTSVKGVEDKSKAAAKHLGFEPYIFKPDVQSRKTMRDVFDSADPLYESQGLAAAFKYLDTLPTNEEGKIVVDGVPYSRMELAQALAPQIVSANSGSLFANNATYRDDMAKRMGYKNMDSYLAALDQRLAAMQGDLANHVSAQHAIQTPFNDMAGLEALATQERAGAKVIRDLRDQIKSMRAGEGGFEQFFKGLNEGFDAVNMVTFGIADLASEYKQNIVYNKMLNGETLTPEERILADALNIKSDLDALREAQGQSWYNNIGTGVGYIGEIAPQFVGPMLAAKGLFKPINVGAKGAWQMTKKTAKKEGFKAALKTGLGATARVGGKGLNNLARFQINGMLTAPLQASTYSRFLEKRNAQYSIKDGKVTYKPTDAWRDLVDTWIEQGAEVGSELFGVSLEKFTSASLAAIGRNIGLGKVLRKIGGSVRDVETSKAMRFVKSGATKAGQQLFGYAGGVLPETLSEIYGDITSEMFKSVLTGNGNFEEFKNLTYWATAFALSGIYGGAISVLPSMVDYASYMRDISALGDIKKKILGDGKIEHTDLKNALIALSAGGSIKDATKHLAELDWKNGGYSLEEIGYAMDYIRAEAMQQVRMGEAAENQRLQRFGNVAQNIEAHAYRDEDGMPSGSMVMAVDKDGNSYHILEGDYSNAEATLKALNSEGKVVPLLASNIVSLSKASIADVTLFYYQQMFSTEFNLQRLESAEYAVELMDNPTMAQVADVAKRVGIVMPKEGDTITLVDGRTAKVTSISDDLGIMAEMTDGEGNTSMVPIPIMQILSSNTYIAEAQKLQNAEDALELAQAEEAQAEAEDAVEEGDATADAATEEASNGLVGTEVTLPDGNKGTIVEVDGDDVVVDTGRGVDAYEVYSKEELGMTEATETTTPQPTQTTAEQTTDEVTPEQATEALNEIAGMEPMPTLEDGSIDYDAIDDAETFAKYFEHDMGSREEAIKGVQEMREQAVADLAEAEKKGKKARSANEKVANKAERQRLAERIAFYDNVLDIYTPKAEAPATPIESAPQVDTTPSQTEAQSPAEPAEGVQPSETIAEEQADGYSKYNEKLERPVGLQHNELSERLEEKTRRMINDVATAFGVEVIFQREVRSSAGNLVNGKIVGSTVYFNWGKREHTLTWLMGHEFTHRMKSLSPEAYEKLRDAVRAYLGEGKWNRLIEKQRKIYEERENPEKILSSAESAEIWEEAKEQTKREDGSFDEEAAKKLYNKKVAEARREAYIEEVVCDEVGVLARDHKAFDRFLRSEHVRNDGKLLRWLRKVWKSLKNAFSSDTRTFKKVMKTLDELIDVSTAEVAKGVEPIKGGEKKSLSAPVFYSNAQYAVQNIKQAKATPEQWLKMIEKNGGLKAGEDKWLGLSDWLKANDKKTLTKDEVLQYIAENDIQIEEVSYGEPEYISENEIYESDAFSNLVASLTDYDEDDNPYINKEQYKELQNADPDFLDGFSLDYWGGGLDIDNKMAAARYLGLLGVDNEINGTRLQYTTQGLTKKREIALVVPTIEPYNQSDDIHFGDAGEGRAVAWVRFGDAEAQRSEEVVRRVDEFETPYKDVNGHEIYRPKDRLYAKDFISYGKLKSGEYAYVVYVNDKQIPVAHKSLEDARNALNEHYKANPEKRTRWDKVLVIDEIQSKRHQDGREKGYKTAEDEELKNAQGAEIWAMMQKYNVSRPSDLRGVVSTEDATRLDELSQHKFGEVPSAPFEKNWAELAFKRMLRYAAENGYDYVAWTTGDQQADRYDIGSVVKDIVAYDTKDADGNPIKKMKFRMNNMGTYNIATNVEGVIVKGDGEMKEGMRLSDITGKALAEKIMNGEGEDAMVFENGKDVEAKSLEGEELHIGNEGMKAFYDQMLPSFVKKYTKKWGAEVGEVTMPDLEENNTMHAVNVTDSMRESVMQGQPKFSLAGTEVGFILENYDDIQDIATAVEAVVKRYPKDSVMLANVLSDYRQNADEEEFIQGLRTFAKYFGDKQERDRSEDKATIEETFGGIWIEDTKEFAKFAKAVNNTPFEEDGEGIAYTDNYFYAYYRNIDGQPVPYASVYLNRGESQNIVDIILKAKRNDEKRGIRRYFDRAYERARHISGENDGNRSSNKKLPYSRRNDRLDSELPRYGAYYDSPELFVKSKRTFKGSKVNYSLITPEMDASYLDAVERGDMAAAQRMVMEAAEKAGYINDESWRMNHRAPRKDEENANPFNTEKIVPEDFWEHPEWYTNIRHSSETRESYYAMKHAIDKYKRLMAEGKTDEADNVTITMYRGVDKTANKREASFRNGDWITPSRSYALLSAPNGKARVISQEVKLKDIWWDGNSINEWGYDDGANYGYRDTKNNRKLLDPVTYDDAGNIIPLSERFNPRKEDIRYSLIGEMGASNIESYGRYGSPAYALEQARDMEADGKSVKEIRVATNWERGKDGKWRYEINDGVYIDPEDKDKEYKLSDILKNDALYEAYPELADMPVYYTELEGNKRGMYDGEAIWLRKTLDEQQAHSTLVHEVQHAIQHREGFARGGNKGMFEQEAIEKLEKTLGDLESEKDKFKSYSKLRKAYLILKYVANSLRLDRAESKAHEQYRRLAGEVEARNVQARMNMSEEERLLIPIGSTEDVARSSQNVIQRELMAADGTRYSLREESAPTRYSLHNEDVPFYTESGDRIIFDDVTELEEERREFIKSAHHTPEDVVRSYAQARHFMERDRIRKEADRAIERIRKEYIDEDERRKVGVANQRTNVGKVDFILHDVNRETMPIKDQLLVDVAQGAIKIIWGESTGLASAIGLPKSDKKHYKNIWKGATKTFDEFVADWIAAHGGAEKGLDFQSVRTALIEVLRDTNKPADAIDNLRTKYAGLIAERDAKVKAAKAEMEQKYSEEDARYNAEVESLKTAEGLAQAQKYYKENIAFTDELNAIRLTISELERKLNETTKEEKVVYRTILNAIREAKAEIKEVLQKANNLKFSSATVQSILHQLDAARSINDLKAVRDRVEGIILERAIRHDRAEMQALLNMHSPKTKGVKKARTIDDETKRVIIYLRDKLIAPEAKRRRTEKVDEDGKVVYNENGKKVYVYEPELELSLDVEEHITTNKERIEELLNTPDGESVRSLTEEEKAELTARELYDHYLKTVAFKQQEANLRKQISEEKSKDVVSTMYNDLNDIRRNYGSAIAEFNETLSDIIFDGKMGLRAFREAKEAHKAKVKQLAINAIKAKITTAQPNIWERSAARFRDFIHNTYYTYEMVLREIDRFAPNGEGEFYEYFMDGFTEANGKFITKQHTHTQSMGDKVKELWDKETKRKNHNEAYQYIMNKAEMIRLGEITWYLNFDKDGNLYNKQTTPLTMANAMDLLASWRQAQYKTAMQKHGITEAMMLELEKKMNAIDPRYIKFMDWVNTEFLPSTRLEYNEVHKQMFGTSMDNIKNYFPASVIGFFEDVDLSKDEGGIPLASTVTGGIMQRQKNNNMVATNQNYFVKLQGHIQNMDQWASFAPYIEDVNVILGKDMKMRYNSVMSGVNKDEERGGAGSLYTLLRTTASIAVGKYKYKTGKLDKFMSKVTRGWAGSNIALRVSTALKQLSSLPIFAAYAADPKAVEYFAKTLLEFRHPRQLVGWATEISPSFKARWDSKYSGNEVLMREHAKKEAAGGIDFRKGKVRRVVETMDEAIQKFATEYGMWPNAAVDALVVAAGIKTIYDYELNKATGGTREATEEEKRKAIIKAEIFFNTTQQSAEGAYLSEIQMQSTFVTTAMNTYKSQSYAMHRKRWHGRKELFKSFFNKEYRRNLTAEQLSEARKRAIMDMTQGYLGDVVFQFMSACGVSAWAFINSMLHDYDDDDEETQTNTLEDIGKAYLNISLGGFVGGSLVSGAIDGYGFHLTPAIEEFIKDAKEISPLVFNKKEDKLEWVGFNLWPIVSAISSYRYGVDPKTLINMAEGFEELTHGVVNGDMSSEAFMKIINTPQSIITKVSSKRRKGETVQEWVNRQMRVETLNIVTEQAKFEELHDKDGKFIGQDELMMGRVGNPFTMPSYRAKTLLKDYNKRQRNAVMSKEFSKSEIERFKRIDEEYKKAVEPLGWKVGNKPEDNLVDKTGWKPIYPEGLSKEHYTNLKGIATEAEALQNAQEKWIGSDEALAAIIRKEYKYREAVIKGKRSPYEASFTKRGIEREKDIEKKQNKYKNLKK